MSIAVLNQVYDEARRLAVAGSVVARGDFRLKKLLPPLEQAGAKAPVFAKVAECARAVVEGAEDKSAENLLELTGLVTAVLYTQGETGIEGKLEPIETINLGGTAAQTSARLLKPLLEALTSTGSGRLELIRDAHERGAFRDLRLVKPAIGGLDDPYPEIADFLAEKVLPLYGRAILPELRAQYDPKGTKGHPRRLKLMHNIDPDGARELVKQALEEGSKEVKVAAIACLGADDLSYLIEQAAAKAQDVRRAAYQALGRVNNPAAVAVLEKAITGKDMDLVASSIERSKNDRLTAVLIGQIKQDWAALPKVKDRKQAGDKALRLVRLIGTLPEGAHDDADALTLELFADRAAVAGVKGDPFSGTDVVESVIQRMSNGAKSLQVTLARSHAELPAESLGAAVEAARVALPAAEVYDQFSPYVTAPADGKKGKEAATRRDAVINALSGGISYIYARWDQEAPPLDPRWLDLAVQVESLELVSAAWRPGHSAAEAFLEKQVDASLKKPRSQGPIPEALTLMVRVGHPRATDAWLASYEKTIGKANAHTYWYYVLIRELPKSALPRLEAIVPRLKGRDADQFVHAIEELRNKE